MILGAERATDASRVPKVLWERPVAPGDGLGATGTAHMYHNGLAAGRAVAAYDQPSGATQLVAIDAATGKTLWEAPTPRFTGLVLTRTRVYLQGIGRQIDVRDAANGKLLGSFGPKE
jgi:hypothetical protein